MIGITIEYQGYKFSAGEMFRSYPKAAMAALALKDDYPDASVFLADREAHLSGARDISEFRKCYASFHAVV